MSVEKSDVRVAGFAIQEGLTSVKSGIDSLMRSYHLRSAGSSELKGFLGSAYTSIIEAGKVADDMVTNPEKYLKR